MTKVNILSGLNIPSQISLDPKTRCINELTLKDLGIDDNLAYTYYKGLEITCIEERTKWEWKEVEIGDEKLLDNDFIYPNGLIIDDIDYSDKSFNFAKIINTPELQDLQSVITTGYVVSGDGGISSLQLFGDSAFSRYFSLQLNNGQSNTSNRTCLLRAYNHQVLMENIYGYDAGNIGVYNGKIQFAQYAITGSTTISYQTPLAITTLKFPAKTIAGIYNIMTELPATYLVSALPSGQLGDRAIVTDANSPTYLGIAVGGGLIKAPVWHNGVNWVTT